VLIGTRNHVDEAIALEQAGVDVMLPPALRQAAIAARFCKRLKIL